MPCVVCYRQSETSLPFEVLSEEVNSHILRSCKENIEHGDVLCEPCSIKFTKVMKISEIGNKKSLSPPLNSGNKCVFHDYLCSYQDHNKSMGLLGFVMN